MVSTAPETRERLLRQGRLAFAEKGHDRVSLQRDILGPAGVSNGSFYHQFSDKTDLLAAVLEDAIARGRAHARHAASEASDTSPVEALRRRLLLLFDLVDGAEDLFRIQLRERNNTDKRVRDLVTDLRHRSSGLLAERLGANEKLNSSSFDQELAARLTMALFTGVVADYLDMSEKQRSTERDRLATGIATFVIGGLTGLANQKPTVKTEIGAS